MTEINAMHMAETVCRRIMADLPDAPLVLETYVRPGEYDYERTDAARLLDQWVVMLRPTLDFVSVGGQGRLRGFGLYDEVDIGGQNDIGPQYDYVTFPVEARHNPALVVGDEYVARLRTSVERAVAAVEADYAAAKAGSDR